MSGEGGGGSFIQSSQVSDTKNKWVETQKKAFKNWANFYLRERGLEIKDLENDLKDGILLINLVELLTGRPVGRYNKNPKLKVQKINNINAALMALRRSKDCEISASAEEIADGNLKMVLGIVWTMVHKFQLQSFGGGPEKAGSTAKDALLDWVIETLQPYKDRADLSQIKKDFPKAFKDGKLFNYLIHVRRPELVNLDTVENRSPAQNLKYALDTAESALSIPKLIDVEDILTSPDEHSMLAYLSYFRSTQLSEEKDRAIESKIGAHEGMLSDISRETAELRTAQEKTLAELLKRQTEKEAEDQRKMAELMAQIAEMKNKGVGSDKDHEQEIEKLKKKHRKAQKKLEAEISRLQQEQKDAARERADMEKRLNDKLRSQKAKKEVAVKMLTEHLKTEKGAGNDELTRLRNEIETLKKRLAEAEAKREADMKTIEDLVKKLQEKEQEKEAIENERKRLEERALKAEEARKSAEEMLELERTKQQNDNNSEWKRKYEAEVAKNKALSEELAKERALREKERLELEARLRELEAANKEREIIAVTPRLLDSVKHISEKKQVIVEKRMVIIEDLDLDLQELKPNPSQTRSIEKVVPETTVKELHELKDHLELQLEEETAKNSNYQKEIHKLQEQLEEEKKEVLRLNLQLEEETANNANEVTQKYEKEITKLKEQLAEEKKERLQLNLLLEEEKANNENENRREINKLKDELEIEKKQLIKLELQLDNEKQNHDAELDELKKQHAQKLEKMQVELHKAQDAAKVALQRVSDLEQVTSREMEVKSSGPKNEVLLDIEELIRQLYYRDGASLHLEDLEDEHRENSKFVEVVNEIRDSVDHVIDDMVNNFYKVDPIPRDPHHVVEDIATLRRFRNDVKREKNNFVRACNGLGEQYALKSDLEYQMGQWKEKLVEIALDEKQCRPDNEQLLEDIDTVKALLRKDDTQKEEVRGYRKSRISARSAVQHLIEKLREYIRADLETGERKRLQGLLSDLKEANRKLETRQKRAAVAQNIYVTKQERERISKVVRLMIQHHKTLFKNYMGTAVSDQVKGPITFLEERGLHLENILDKKDVNFDKVEDLKNRFYKDPSMGLDPNSDPYIIAELLKEFFRDLPQPLLTYKRYNDFDAINEVANANALDELRLAIDELPKVRRATLAQLITFLAKVNRFSDDNKMDTPKLADIFGPLLLRPYREKQ